MSIPDRWWVIAAFAATLAGASASTWTTRGPRLETITASAATRHGTPSRRSPAADTLLLSAPDPPPPTRPTARPSPASPPPAKPDGDILWVPDLPEPPAHEPLTWDELFPAKAREPGAAPDAPSKPCFDQLQGIRGLSPCPAVTPR